MALPTEEERRNWLRWLMTQQSPTSHGIGQGSFEDLEKVPGEVKDIWQSTAVEPTDDPGAFWGLIDSTLGRGSRYLREAASEAPTTVQTIPAKLASHMMGLVTDPIEKHVTGQPVTTGDVAMAGLSAIPYVGTGVKAGVGLGKEALKAWRAQMKNLLEFKTVSPVFQPARSIREGAENIFGYRGTPEEVKVSFYSGVPGAAPAAMAEGLVSGTKDFFKQIYSLSDSYRWRSQGISKQKVDRVREYMEETDRIFSNPDNWKHVTGQRTRSGKFKKGSMELTQEAKDSLKKWNKVVAGDLNTMVKMAQREGADLSPLQRQWDNIHFDQAKYTNSSGLADELRALPVSEGVEKSRNTDQIADFMNRSWKMGDDNFLLTRMKERVSAGSATSPSDAQMTPAYVAIAKAYKSGARTADEYNAYFKTLGWKPRIDKVEDSSNGVLFSYSPDRKSDLYKGGFNVVAEVGGNGKSTFWISDEFHLGAGVLKKAIETGMESKLLVVQKPKTIRTPEITEKGYNQALAQVEKDIRKQYAGEASKARSKSAAAGTDRPFVGDPKRGILPEEEGIMRGILADQKIPLGYRAKFYGTRYGLPGIATGLALPEKRKREELYE